MMTYFHPRDFDPGQPMLEGIPPHRRFKSYVGLKSSFAKFRRYLDDFEFIDLRQADERIDWNNAEKIKVE
jgi:hypothetical protein